MSGPSHDRNLSAGGGSGRTGRGGGAELLQRVAGVAAEEGGEAAILTALRPTASGTNGSS